jgi:hypothetical protein
MRSLTAEVKRRFFSSISVVSPVANIVPRSFRAQRR